MATDTSIVTIYDMENEGAPLQCHRIDAREFLGHSSGRWSASPEGKKKTVGDAEPLDVGGDSGKIMQLKAMHYKALGVMAIKANIRGAEHMKKAELVEALLKFDEPPEKRKNEE